ncbi:GlcG/HbpS family heme-binding protein [Cereibacter johrii]|uniref:GlcG/HbpS family heme-binding protein n=1 Tax=Cereibacter johrii TaxID=445629 RepID=UPI003CEB57A7
MSLSTKHRSTLAASSALALAQKAFEIGTDMQVAISIAVVGASAERLTTASMDDATMHSRETSLKKAQTAASTRRATGWMSGSLAVELPMASGGLLTNVPGGFPITIDGVVVGGLGIAGGTVEQDAQIATAVLNAFLPETTEAKRGDGV